MQKIVKPRAVELALAVLRKEIETGEWGERLPGARSVAKRLGVSPPTVTAALVRLVGEGLLEKGGERRAYRLAGAGGRSQRKMTADVPRRLLILTHEEPEHLVGVARVIIEKLRVQMSERGWKVDHQVIDFLHVKNAQTLWDQKIAVNPGTAVIALYGRPPLAKWAVRNKVRMLFLGGVNQGFPVPMISVKSSVMAEIAMQRLTALGHSRIMLPLCDRGELFKESLREVTRRAIEATGQTYVKSYHNPESPYLKPDVTWRILEAAFSVDPPTALVLLDWKELVTAQCYLQSAGLKIPEDVSVILLNDQTEAEWFFPKLFRFRFPVRRILNLLVRWLEGGDDGPLLQRLPSVPVEGDTIAPPPQRRFKTH